MLFGRGKKTRPPGVPETTEPLQARIDALADRVAALERLLGGHGTLRAQQVVLQGEDGSSQIILSSSGPAGPEVSLCDSQGRVRLRLRVVSDMPVFELQDDRENSKTWFGVGADGNPTIQLRDGTGRDRLRLGVSRRQGAKLILVDAGGRTSTVVAEGVLLSDEGIVKTLYLKADAEQQRAARPQLTLLQGGLSEMEDKEREEDPT